MVTPNRSFRESFPFAANGTAKVKLRLDPRSNATFAVQYENRGDASATIKLQDSVDGITYTDVTGSSATVVPGGTTTVLVNVRKYFQFIGTGNAEVEAIVSGDIFAHEITRL